MLESYQEGPHLMWVRLDSCLTIGRDILHAYFQCSSGSPSWVVLHRYTGPRCRDEESWHAPNPWLNLHERKFPWTSCVLVLRTRGEFHDLSLHCKPLSWTPMRHPNCQTSKLIILEKQKTNKKLLYFARKVIFGNLWCLKTKLIS